MIVIPQLIVRSGLAPHYQRSSRPVVPILDVEDQPVQFTDNEVAMLGVLGSVTNCNTKHNKVSTWMGANYLGI